MSQLGQPSPAARPGRGSRPARRPPGVGPATGSVPTTGATAVTGPSPAVRRRRLLFAVLGVIVLVGGGFGVWNLVKGGGAGPTAAASTVVVPSPTPTIAPVKRSATTPFAHALPASVLQFALSSSTQSPDWAAKGALEAYDEEYSDGHGGTIGLRVGQWPTVDEATAVFTALATGSAGASATPDAHGLPRNGQVTVAGKNAGAYTIVNNGDGTGTALWTNGTAVFQLTTTVDEVARAYAAFPL